jgi:hypothetical protein
MGLSDDRSFTVVRINHKQGRWLVFASKLAKSFELARRGPGEREVFIAPFRPRGIKWLRVNTQGRWVRESYHEFAGEVVEQLGRAVS